MSNDTMNIYKVTVIIETDEDPSRMLDLAIEVGERLARDTNGTTDENDACVQSMSSSDYARLRG
jgi:hypothetical protein